MSAYLEGSNFHMQSESRTSDLMCCTQASRDHLLSVCTFLATLMFKNYDFTTNSPFRFESKPTETKQLENEK